MDLLTFLFTLVLVIAASVVTYWKGGLYATITFLMLMVAWALFSGLYDRFHLTLGVISALYVTWISSDLLFSDREATLEQRIRQGWRMSCYIPWLLWQVLLSNIQILRLVLSPNLKKRLAPSIVRIETPLESDFEKFALATSITLTPGTVTTRICGNELYVHAITRNSAKGLDGQMDRRIRRIFEKGGQA